MSKAFEYALREHFRVNGEIKGTYGNTSLVWHVRETDCTGWVIPAGATATPGISYDFNGTDADHAATQVLKLDAEVSCECGKYEGNRIQVEGTMGELVALLLNIEVPGTVTF